MYQVTEINDAAQLDSLQADWHRLLARTRRASFFQSYEWFSTYWAHFGRSMRLRVVCISEGDELVGIMPLVVRHEQRRLRPLSVLTYPLDAWGSFYGPIGSVSSRALRAALVHLRDTPRDWDLLELSWVDATGSDAGRTAAALAGALMPAEVQRQQSSALIDLAAFGNWNNYWASRTSRWRNNVRRNQRRLVELGRVEYVRYRPLGAASGDDDPRWDLYEACERLAESSWQSDSTTGTTLSHEAVRPFLRDCHLAAARAGALDLNLLLVNDVAVAFNYAYHYRGHVFGLRTGYDRQTSADGAGSALQAAMIEDSFVRGDHTYDLGPEYLDCKRYWQSEVRASYRYTYFPPAPLAQLVRAKRQIERLWRELAVQQGVTI